MPKRPLKPEFSNLFADFSRTFLAGHHVYRPDLQYPESASDMQGGFETLIRKYDIILRTIPLDREDIFLKD